MQAGLCRMWDFLLLNIKCIIYQIFILNIQKAEQLAVIKMPDS